MDVWRQHVDCNHEVAKIMGRTTSVAGLKSMGDAAESRRMDASLFEKFVAMVKDLHPADQKELMKTLAVSVLQREPKRHLISDENRFTIGFLAPVEYLLQIAETDEERAALQRAMSIVSERIGKTAG